MFRPWSKHLPLQKNQKNRARGASCPNFFCFFYRKFHKRGLNFSVNKKNGARGPLLPKFFFCKKKLGQEGKEGPVAIIFLGFFTEKKFRKRGPNFSVKKNLGRRITIFSPDL